MRSFLRERQLGILVAGVLVFFFRPLTTWTFFFRDNALLNIPTHLLLARFLRDGRIPLWNPTLHGGQPFLGCPTSTLLYPSNLLDLILPPLTAFNVTLVLHYALCAAFAYLLARSLGIRPNAAMVAGIVYAISGFSLSQANLDQKLLALPWIPFCLLAARESLRSRPRLWLSLLIAGLLTQLIASSPETTVATGILVILFAAVTAGRARALGALLRVMPAMALAGGLAAVVLIPAAEMTAGSSRGPQRSYESFTTWSLHPNRLPELFVPGFFGRTDALSDDAYWGARREDTGFPNILSIYFGFPALLLAFLGATASAFTPGIRRLWIACAILGLALACGRYLPGFHALYRLVPIVALFRYPIKAIVFGLLPISLLAAAGADSLAERRPLMLRLCVAATVLTSLLLALLWCFPAVAPALERAAFARTLPVSDQRALLLAFVHLLATELALLGVASRWRVEVPTDDRRRSWFLRSQPTAWLAAIVACDLAVAGLAVNPYAERSLFAEPPLAGAVRSVAAGDRFYRAPDPQPFHLAARSDDVIWLARFDLLTLRDYTSQAWGIPTIFHTDFDGLANRDIVRLGTLVNHLPWRRRLPILSAAGARAIMAPGRLLLPGLRPVLGSPEPTGFTWILHENPAAARVRFVAAARTFADREQLLKAMSSGPFDPAREVFLEGASVPPNHAGFENARLEILQQEPDRSLVAITSPVRGWVVYAEPFAPGWSVRMDGQPVPSLRANYAFTAVDVPAGRYQLERVYRPRSVSIGLAATGVSFLLALLFVWWAGTGEPGASALEREAPGNLNP